MAGVFNGGLRAPVMHRYAPRSNFWVILSTLLGSHIGNAMQFEIPAEMLEGLMGGMMGGGGRGNQPEPTEWPKTENSEITADMEWIINTEWQGKTAKYSFLRDGIIESPLKECEHEGMCLWAANNNKIAMNTPTLKVVKFIIEGYDKADKSKLQSKDSKELGKLRLVAEKPGKSGKKSQLTFSQVLLADDSDSYTGEDLYALLGSSEEDDQAKIKSKFRRLSVQNHPDKGGDPHVFNQIREAYEVLSDPELRKFYDQGGMQVVKNVQLAWKEVEGQQAQLDAELNKVPKNHPQYQMYKAKIDQQKKKFEKSNMKHEIENKFRNDDLEVMVPISAAELYNGVSKKSYDFKRLVICRGCRAHPESPECQDCGRCPPEKIQVPQYGMTPFGRQVVGMKEKEQESRERCREVIVPVKGLNVPKGAKNGQTLKYLNDIGHQTPGKLPGKVVLKVQRGSSNDTYTIAESDLHTVLHISLEQALFGFSQTFKHLGSETVTVSRKQVASTNEVLRLQKKGLLGEGGVRGDLYVRLAIDLPQLAKGSSEVTLKAASQPTETKLEREDQVELREGSAWRLWRDRESALSAKSSKSGKAPKQEL